MYIYAHTHVYCKHVHVVWGVYVWVLFLTFILPCYLTISLQLTCLEFILKNISFSHDIPYDVV